MISIDFIAGSHGHFLELVCNKFLAKIDINFEPFNELGAAHNSSKDYTAKKLFFAGHYSELAAKLHKKIIQISFTTNDILPLMSVSMLRAGDLNIDNDNLEFNTYHKLNNRYYSNLLNNIRSAYPDITITPENPDCPRYILREFFKFSFRDPENNGLYQKQKLMSYDSFHDVIEFKFENFYNLNNFILNLEKIAAWYGTDLCSISDIATFWEKFYSKQIYKNAKKTCDNIIEAVKSGKHVAIENLNLFQESYINGVLEKIYKKEMPFVQPFYFTNTKEIISYINTN